MASKEVMQDIQLLNAWLCKRDIYKCSLKHDLGKGWLKTNKQTTTSKQAPTHLPHCTPGHLSYRVSIFQNGVNNFDNYKYYKIHFSLILLNCFLYVVIFLAVFSTYVARNYVLTQHSAVWWKSIGLYVGL